MKKISVLLTVLVLGALLLAACGQGGAAEGTPGVGTMEPGTGLETPATGLETPTEGMATDVVEPTTQATTPAAVDTTPTTETDSGSLPQTGSQFVLLSDVLSLSVNGQDGAAVGSVNGVLIDRPTGMASESTDMGTDSLSTPAATESTGGAAATATQSTSTDGSGTDVMAAGNNPRISFVLVSVTGASSSTSGDTGATAATATLDANATPAATEAGATGDSGSMASDSASGGQVLVPWQAFEVASASGAGDMALTLTVDPAVLASAPAFSESDFAGTVSEDVTAYWSGEGLTIPMTGGVAESANSILLRGQIGSIQINDLEGKSFGQVRDFVVDTTTGELVYAILGGGQGSMGDLYVVPFNILAWSESMGAAASGGEANSLGSFDLTVGSDLFTNAPTITSLDELDFSTPDWQSQFDSFWSTSTLEK